MCHRKHNILSVEAHATQGDNYSAGLVQAQPNLSPIYLFLDYVPILSRTHSAASYLIVDPTRSQLGSASG